EIIDPPAILRRHRLVGIEAAGHARTAATPTVHPRHLAGYAAGVVRGIEGGDVAEAGLSGQQFLPDVFPPLAQGRDQADPGDDDATHPTSIREPPRLKVTRATRRPLRSAYA